MYNIIITPSCQDAIDKICKKNLALKIALERKIEQIAKNPEHYKPLMYDFAGERRVHIMRSFVLKFKIYEDSNTVLFILFGHHDEAYKH